jgi:hypothetical protein
MNVDPADASAMQAPIANEGNDVAVRNDTRLMHLFIGGQERPAPSTIADEKFSIDQVMADHCIEAQESIQFDRVGRPVGKEPNPHGRIDKDHQPALRLADGLSRRLGTSRA